MKIIFYNLILALLTGVTTNSIAAESPLATNAVLVTPAFVNRLSEELRTNHPALRAAGARTTAATAEVAAVRTWEDPMLIIGGMAADEMMRKDEGDLIYGVEQKLPLFGKPALARRIASAGLEVEQADADFQFQLLRSELAKTAFRTALADQTIAIGAEDLIWLRTMAETMESNYQVNAASLFDLTQIQNEKSRRENQFKTSHEELHHMQFALNRLLNRELQSAWPVLQLPPVAAPIIYSPKLADMAVRYEPKLRMMREQIKKAQAEVDATKRSRLPDVNLGLQSRNFSGNGEWRQAEIMFSFNLPLFNRKKYRADIQRDEAKLQASQFDAADYTLSVNEEIHGLTVKIDATRREALLYRDTIIPRSQAALAGAQSSWESGRGMFRDMLEARRMLLDARLMYLRAVAEQYEMLTDLVLCCGIGDLEALQMLSPQIEGVKP